MLPGAPAPLQSWRLTTACHWDSAQICQTIAKGQESVAGQKSGVERDKLCLTQCARHSETSTDTGLTALPGRRLQHWRLQHLPRNVKNSKSRITIPHFPTEKKISVKVVAAACSWSHLREHEKPERCERKTQDFLTPTVWISFKNILLLQNWVTNSQEWPFLSMVHILHNFAFMTAAHETLLWEEILPNLDRKDTLLIQLPWNYFSKEGTSPAKIQQVLTGAAAREPGTSDRKTTHTPTSVRQLLEEYWKIPNFCPEYDISTEC